MALIVALNLVFGGAALLGLARQPGALARPAEPQLSPADQAVLEQVAALLGQPAELSAAPDAAGAQIVDAGGVARTVALLRLDAEGNPVVACVTTVEEARAFLAGSDAIAAALLDEAPGAAKPAPAGPRPSLEQLLASTQTEITIVNLDGPNEGFNDPTPAAPSGGNPGTTVGEQRRLAFEYAAAIWANAIQSTVPIRIGARFDPLECGPPTVLGSAGPLRAYTFPLPGSATVPPGARPNVQYTGALANKLVGQDLSPGASDYEILAQFNSELGKASCREDLFWYYGFDGNEGSGTDLVTVLLHEFAHGLGFISLGAVQSSVAIDDIWTYGLFDNQLGKFWKDLSPSERSASASVEGRLSWGGPAVSGEAPYALGGVPALTLATPSGPLSLSPLSQARFGPRVPLTPLGAALSAAADPADAAGPSATDACSPLSNAAAVAGTIALADLGGCDPATKARNAEAAGAVALLLADNLDAAAPPALGGAASDIGIPVVGLTRQQGQSLRPSATIGGAQAQLGLDRSQLAGVDAQGRALMYTPTQFRPGSSVSHFDVSAAPNLLMEPRINRDLGQGLDLTDELLRDTGWYPDINYNLIDDRGELRVALSQFVSPAGLAQPGAPITVTVTVRNTGPQEARVTVRGSFSGGLEAAGWAATYSGGASGPAQGDLSPDAAVTLPPGARATFTVSAVVPAEPGAEPLISAASLSFEGAATDLDPENNASSVSVPVARERVLLPELRAGE